MKVKLVKKIVFIMILFSQVNFKELRGMGLTEYFKNKMYNTWDHVKKHKGKFITAAVLTAGGVLAYVNREWIKETYHTYKIYDPETRTSSFKFNPSEGNRFATGEILYNGMFKEQPVKPGWTTRTVRIEVPENLTQLDINRNNYNPEANTLMIVPGNDHIPKNYPHYEFPKK